MTFSPQSKATTLSPVSPFSENLQSNKSLSLIPASSMESPLALTIKYFVQGLILFSSTSIYSSIFCSPNKGFQHGAEPTNGTLTIFCEIGENTLFLL